MVNNMNLIESSKKVLLNEAEAFDDFDQVYLDNHKTEIAKLEKDKPDSGAGLSGTEKEVYLFWSMHRQQISKRI